MNGVPATIVIRHLMAGTAPTPVASRRPSTRTTEPRPSRTSGGRLAVSLALLALVATFVVAVVAAQSAPTAIS